MFLHLAVRQGSSLLFRCIGNARPLLLPLEHKFDVLHVSFSRFHRNSGVVDPNLSPSEVDTLGRRPSSPPTPLPCSSSSWRSQFQQPFQLWELVRILIAGLLLTIPQEVAHTL